MFSHHPHHTCRLSGKRIKKCSRRPGGSGKVNDDVEGAKMAVTEDEDELS